MGRMWGVLVLALLACGRAEEPARDASPDDAAAPDDAASLDAWTAPARDGGIDGDLDAAPAPTGLVSAMTSTRIDDCVGDPALTWNGEGWGLWWYDCPSRSYLIELDEAGHVGARFYLPPLPPGDTASFVSPTSVAFAHGLYAIAGSAYPGTETAFWRPFIGTMDRAGAGAPFLAVLDGSFVYVDGWDDTPGWWTIEEGGPGGVRLVTRDEAMTELSRTTLTSGAEHAHGPAYDLAWDTMRLSLIAPDGTVTPLAVSDVSPYDAVPWNDGFLVTAWGEPVGTDRYDLVVLDPTHGADVRAHVPDRGAVPSVAGMPERERAAVCWHESVLQPSGDYAFVYFVQLYDLVAGDAIGAPTVVSMDPDGQGGPTCVWGGTHLLYVWANIVGTFVASYTLAP